MLTGESEYGYFQFCAIESNSEALDGILIDNTLVSPIVKTEVIFYDLDSKPVVFCGYSGCLPNGTVIVALFTDELPKEHGVWTARVIRDPYSENDDFIVDEIFVTYEDPTE